MTKQDVVETSVLQQVGCKVGECEARVLQSQECLAAKTRLLGVLPALEKLCALSQKFNFPVH